MDNIQSLTNEGQDAKAKVMCNRGDNSTHPQNSQCRITARDYQVTCQIPKNFPVQHVSLKKTNEKCNKH